MRQWPWGRPLAIQPCSDSVITHRARKLMLSTANTVKNKITFRYTSGQVSEVLQWGVVKDFKAHGSLQTWGFFGSPLWENRLSSNFHMYVPWVTKCASTPGTKGTKNGPYSGPLSQVSNLGSNLGCLRRSRRKQVNHHILTELCKHGRAATGEGTVPLPPSAHLHYIRGAGPCPLSHQIRL